MAQHIISMLAWLPAPLNIVCIGVVALFFLFTVLHLIAFILDIVPFL